MEPNNRATQTPPELRPHPARFVAFAGVFAGFAIWAWPWIVNYYSPLDFTGIVIVPASFVLGAAILFVSFSVGRSIGRPFVIYTMMVGVGSALCFVMFAMILPWLDVKYNEDFLTRQPVAAPGQTVQNELKGLVAPPPAALPTVSSNPADYFSTASATQYFYQGNSNTVLLSTSSIMFHPASSSVSTTSVTLNGEYVLFPQGWTVHVAITVYPNADWAAYAFSSEYGDREIGTWGNSLRLVAEDNGYFWPSGNKIISITAEGTSQASADYQKFEDYAIQTQYPSSL